MRRLVVSACLILILHAPTRALAQEGPFIQIVPNSPVANGQQVTLYGVGFCSASNCSDVKIENGQLLIFLGVKVGADGKFQHTFAASGVLGNNTITATQTAADGSTIKASTGIVFAAADYPPGEDPYKNPVNNPLPTPLPTPTNNSSPKPSPSQDFKKNIAEVSPTPFVASSSSQKKDDERKSLESEQIRWSVVITVILAALGTAAYSKRKQLFRIPKTRRSK